MTYRIAICSGSVGTVITWMMFFTIVDVTGDSSGWYVGLRRDWMEGNACRVNSDTLPPVDSN